MAAALCSLSMNAGHDRVHPFFARSAHDVRTQPVIQDRHSHRGKKGKSAQRALKNTGHAKSSEDEVPQERESNSSHVTPPSLEKEQSASLKTDPNPRRRKKRKVGNANACPATLEDSPTDVDSGLSLVEASQKEIPGSHAPSSDVGHDSANGREAQVVNGTLGSQPDTLNTPDTTLRLNAQGGLGPPRRPQSPDQGSSLPLAKRRRRKGAQSKKMIVVLRYGGSDEAKRHTIGEKIEQIQSLSDPPPQIAIEGNPTLASAVNPLKPTHPFFTAKPAANPNACHDNPKAITQPVEKKQRDGAPRQSFTTPVKPKRPLSEHHPDAADWNPSLDSARSAARSRCPPGPPWPWKGLSHMSLKDVGRYTSRRYSDARNPAKMKGVSHECGEPIPQPVTGSKDEAMMPFFSSKFSSVKSTLPTRTVESAKSLRERVLRLLATASPDDAAGHAARPVPPSDHPALEVTFQSIGRTLTAFDCGSCASLTWLQKYAPRKSSHILQPSTETKVLRDWLAGLTVDAVEKQLQRKEGSRSSSPNKGHDRNKRTKRRKRYPDDLDGFLVSSDEDNDDMQCLTDTDIAGELNKHFSASESVIRSGDVSIKGRDPRKVMNAILLSGPSGCGKSAAARATAQELGFSVFEINSSTKRSGKDILERVGDMALNHQVNKNEASTEDAPIGLAEDPEAGQNMLTSFFTTAIKKPHHRGVTVKSKKTAPREVQKKSPRQQKQSLILLEEVDVLFEDDKQFWETVIDLAKQSRRPIIMTCTDETTVPLESLSLHAILRFRPPPLELATTYLCLVAACEGHLLHPADATSLYRASRKDLRSSIAQLNFWCQMTIGSEKGGMDWHLKRWPIGCDMNFAGDQLHVVSNGTYRAEMTLPLSILGTLPEEAAMMEAWTQYGTDPSAIAKSILDTSAQGFADSMRRARRKDQLAHLKIYESCIESLSAVDAWQAFDHPILESNRLDLSLPFVQEARRVDYTQDYPVLQTEPEADHGGLSADIYTAMCVGIRQISSQLVNQDEGTSGDESRSLSAHLRKSVLQPRTLLKHPAKDLDLATAFDPLLEDPIDRLHPRLAIVGDIGPYARTIAAFDRSLEQYRVELTHALEGATSDSPSKRSRTTRASRSALEGSQRASTRRERWFDREADYAAILATAGDSWPRIEADLLRNERCNCLDSTAKIDAGGRPHLLCQSSESD